MPFYSTFEVHFLQKYVVKLQIWLFNFDCSTLYEKYVRQMGKKSEVNPVVGVTWNELVI